MVIECRRPWSVRLPPPSQSARSRSVLRCRPDGYGSTAVARCCAALLLFLLGVVGMTLSPWYGLAFVLLLIGGLGTAAFSNMQTTLILIEAPAAMRSRVMGIVTMSIGTGPLGVLAAGMLSEWLGPATAILIMASFGLAGLSLVRTRLIRRCA